jgi:diadenosine tetraphosphatase ApaH/serine/threonine PP2A family protein phosphatase
VNPGSVGQPRDGDPRAAYAIFDAESRRLELRRVAYDVGTCADKAARAGLLAHTPARGIGAGLAALLRRAP